MWCQAHVAYKIAAQQQLKNKNKNRGEDDDLMSIITAGGEEKAPDLDEEDELPAEEFNLLGISASPLL